MNKKPLFRLGLVVATPGAIAALTKAGAASTDLLHRHQCGDWGSLCEEDKQANADALKHGSRILSAYMLCPVDGEPEEKIWIITEADRSSTTLLLPEEY